MNFLIASLAIFLAASVLSVLGRGKKAKIFFSCFGVVIGSLLGLIPAAEVLAGRVSLEGMWFSNIPGLVLALGVDPLSAFFLVILFVLSTLVAVYSLGYLKKQPRLAAYYPFFPILVGSMAAVVVARDGFLFLICWEVMSLSSFFLVSVEHDSKEVRLASWIYLIATHLATAFLMVFFVLLFKNAGTFLFVDYRHLSLSPSLAGLLFVFALIGFGTKAGLFPFHIWLPHAHPAAASPISALMSGVMIKMGVYGILRTLIFLGAPQLWWGELLMLLGILSVLLGILYAFVQDDIKRLLAYSSVENMGIIMAAIGLGIMGIASSSPWIAGLGFVGALFHVLNHSLFKGLLFLSAGGVIHASHTRSMNLLGGLLKPMPVTGRVFLVAAMGACGFPIFNGFISEWLIYMGLFQGGQNFSHFPLFLSVAGVVAIAFSGGLALATFAKAFGVVFLGNPRSREAAVTGDVSLLMGLPMLVLAFFCLTIGLYPQAFWGTVLYAAGGLLASSSDVAAGAASITRSMGAISLVGGGLLILFLLLLLARHLWMRKKQVCLAATWGCGYAYPTPRMQYSSPSFAEPISAFFKTLLRPAVLFKPLTGLFPAPARFIEHYNDLGEERFFFPVFERVSRFFAFLRRLQKSRTQDYLMFMFVTLIFLLLWEVWFGI